MKIKNKFYLIIFSIFILVLIFILFISLTSLIISKKTTKYELAEEIQKAIYELDIIKIQRISNVLNLIFMIGLAIIISIALLLLSKKQLKSLNKLIHGTKIIGNGNLDHIVEVTTKDEISDLASSFNQMTQKLKSITTSHDNLNKEIKRRNKAEKALRKATTECKKAEEEKQIYKTIDLHMEHMTSLGHLSSAIVHEINQPLQSIKILSEGILYLDKTKDKLNYKDIIKDINKISINIDRINNIIKSMRSLIRSPKELEIKNIDITKQIRIPINYFKQKLKAHEISLKLKLFNKPVKAIASEMQFHQIMINLIDNAISALDRIGKKNKKIIIQTEANDKEVIIKIIDNGPGINTEIKDQIFNPFQTLKYQTDNIGMGLFIIKNILNCFNGDIQAGNNEYGGATFTIKLKRAKEEKQK